MKIIGTDRQNITYEDDAVAAIIQILQGSKASHNLDAHSSGCVPVEASRKSGGHSEAIIF